MTGDAEGAKAKAAANLVCFHLAGRRFGCPIAAIKETITVKPLTRVFLTPPWVAGIINLRGDVLAVIDLCAFLGLGRTAVAPETRIVIARAAAGAGAAERTAGFLVDRLTDPRAADLSALDPPPATLDAEIAALVAGVLTLPDGEPLAVLDLAAILRSPRMRVRAQ